MMLYFLLIHFFLLTTSSVLQQKPLLVNSTTEGWFSLKPMKLAKRMNWVHLPNNSTYSNILSFTDNNISETVLVNTTVDLVEWNKQFLCYDLHTFFTKTKHCLRLIGIYQVWKPTIAISQPFYCPENKTCRLYSQNHIITEPKIPPYLEPSRLPTLLELLFSNSVSPLNSSPSISISSPTVSLTINGPGCHSVGFKALNIGLKMQHRITTGIFLPEDKYEEAWLELPACTKTKVQSGAIVSMKSSCPPQTN